MTHYYVMNMAGCPLSDKNRGTIASPRFELFTHVTLKTAQAGTILGAGLIGPIVSLAQGNRDSQSIQRSAYKYGYGGLITGLVIGPAMVLAKMAKLNRDGVHDRSYALRFHKCQNFVDRLSIVGAMAGVGAAHLVGDELGKGALFGFAGGCVLAGVINNVF